MKIARHAGLCRDTRGSDGGIRQEVGGGNRTRTAATGRFGRRQHETFIEQCKRHAVTQPHYDLQCLATLGPVIEWHWV